jgi:SAM-dependent methyltransferase
VADFFIARELILNMQDEKRVSSTDAAWEEWGRRDPYFGVITNPKYRRSGMNDDAKREFFDSGKTHVDYILETIRRYITPDFAPKSVLDFGCGVGRVVVALAAIADHVVGLDVSPSMLREAQINCDERALRNVVLRSSDDELSTLDGTFDLIHSFIVLQHVPVARGRKLVGNLLRYIRPTGIGAIHLTYSKSTFVATHGVPPPEPPAVQVAGERRPSGGDPEMQMNPYNTNEILFLLQNRGIQRLHAQFTNHGGELGMFLFFEMPPII